MPLPRSQPAPSALCATHPSAPAVSICSRCGAFVCSTCRRSRADGKEFCPRCLVLFGRDPLPWDTTGLGFPIAFVRTAWRMAAAPRRTLTTASHDVSGTRSFVLLVCALASIRLAIAVEGYGIAKVAKAIALVGGTVPGTAMFVVDLTRYLERQFRPLAVSLLAAPLFEGIVLAFFGRPSAMRRALRVSGLAAAAVSLAAVAAAAVSTGAWVAYLATQSPAFAQLGAWFPGLIVLFASPWLFCLKVVGYRKILECGWFWSLLAATAGPLLAIAAVVGGRVIVARI